MKLLEENGKMYGYEITQRVKGWRRTKNAQKTPTTFLSTV
jgi:hypothetical protein